jgi:hypothetical protein
MNHVGLEHLQQHKTIRAWAPSRNEGAWFNSVQQLRPFNLAGFQRGCLCCTPGIDIARVFSIYSGNTEACVARDTAEVHELVKAWSATQACRLNCCWGVGCHHRLCGHELHQAGP